MSKEKAASLARRSGGCHCGAVRWEVEADWDAVELIECNCSICTKKGFLHLIVEKSAFNLVSGADEISDYRFGTGVAVHKFCRHCGIHSFYVPRSHPDGFSVNARCLDQFEPGELPVVGFDGRHWEDNVSQIQ